MSTSAEAERFQIAVAMANDGIEMMRQNLRRQHPAETEAEISRRLDRWLFDRPMDAPGRVVPGPTR